MRAGRCEVGGLCAMPQAGLGFGDWRGGIWGLLGAVGRARGVAGVDGAGGVVAGVVPGRGG